MAKKYSVISMFVHEVKGTEVKTLSYFTVDAETMKEALNKSEDISEEAFNDRDTIATIEEVDESVK